MEDAITGTTEAAIISEPQNEAEVKITPPDDTGAETRLTTEISELWANHSRLSWQHKVTAARMRQTRQKLGERLFDMKSVISRPNSGRGGRWKPWLRAMLIPRSSADRLIARHVETMFGDEEAIPIEAVSEPEQVYAEKMAKLVWSHSMCFLSSHESVMQFITHLLTAADVVYEDRDDGLVIPNPVPEDVAAWHSSLRASAPAPQPSDGDSGVAGKPGEGTAATLMMAGLAGAAADASGEAL